MSSIKECLSGLFDRKTEPITRQLHGVEFTINNPTEWTTEIIFDYGDFETAEKSGIYPTTLRSIIEQTGEEKLPYLVLFDTKTRMGGGNHWRVIELMPEKDLATIRFCQIFGWGDFERVDDITISYDQVFFTGVTDLEWEIDGNKATLQEVVSINKELGTPNKSAKCKKDTIYFSRMSNNGPQLTRKSI